MVLTVPIPQDVIDNIVDELSDDIDALKNCALVSHSFYLPGRRHFFSTIRLDCPSLSRNLYEHLTRNPSITAFIRELYILPASKSDDIYWFVTDRFCPLILGMLQKLELLSLGDKTSRFFCWDWVSSELQLALADQVRSPSLAEFKIFRCLRLPISVLSILTLNLKKLTILWVDFLDDVDTDPAAGLNSGQLEALELIINTEGTLQKPPRRIFTPMHRLRLLSVAFCNSDTLTVMQELVLSCASSIESICMWHYEGKQKSSKLIDVTIIPNLHSLLFQMDLVRLYESEFINALDLLLQRNHERAVTETVRELTIAVRLLHYPTWNDAMQSLSNSFNQLKLDSFLWAWGRILHKVRIFIEIDVDAHKQSELRAFIRQCLPRIDERGILLVGTGPMEELGTRVWSSVGKT